MNGIKTIIHEIIFNPLSHNIFKITVKTIDTINFKKAVLYIVL